MHMFTSSHFSYHLDEVVIFNSFDMLNAHY